MFCLRNNFESALIYLKKGLQKEPKSIKIIYGMGWAYRLKGDRAKAIQCYETIIGYDSLYVKAYNLLGEIYNDKADYDRSIAYHKKATRIAPNDPNGFKGMGKTYSDKGDYPKALHSYQKAVLINDKDHETYCLMAELYQRQGNSQREMNSYKKAAKLGNKKAQQWLVKRGATW